MREARDDAEVTHSHVSPLQLEIEGLEDCCRELVKSWICVNHVEGLLV